MLLVGPPLRHLVGASKTVQREQEAVADSTRPEHDDGDEEGTERPDECVQYHTRSGRTGGPKSFAAPPARSP